MPLNSRRTVLVSIALMVLIAIIYWPTLRSEFINYDDPDYVTANKVVQRGITGEGLKWAFGRLHGEATYWHPLTWISHMLDCQFFGLNPGWHHATSVLFHMANSILLLLFLKKLTGAFWPSTAVAALFAVHPLQVETVAWVTERKNLLSTLFWLLASTAYVYFARTKKLGPYIVSLLLFACGLMSKPAVVTLPFVFLLLDFWPLKRISIARPWREQFKALGMLLLEKLPYLALSAASAGITILAHERIGIKAEVDQLPLLYRIQNAVVSYAQYLKKIFFPFDLGIVYPHPRTWPAEKVIIASLVLLAVTIVVVACLKKRPYLGTGWCWFLGVLVPAIGIIQVGYQAMADRFVYVPIIGVLIMIAWAAADLFFALRTRPVAVGVLFAGVLLYFVGAAVSQVRHWKDSETVFRRALAVTQRNYFAHINLADALAAKGKLDEAAFQAREAIEIHDKDQLPFLLLGSIEQQRTNFPGAIVNFSRALALNPSSAAARYRLAIALLNNRDVTRAKEHFLILSEAPAFKAEAHASLGQILASERDPAAAVQHYRQALQTRPDWPVVLNNLAWLLATNPDAQLRNGVEAVQLAQRACKLTNDEMPMYIGTLAAAHAEAGQFADAVATARRAQSLALEKGLPELAQRNAELLKLYEAGKPVRDTP
jgi:protein O-mannosyl-transferase